MKVFDISTGEVTKEFGKGSKFIEALAYVCIINFKVFCFIVTEWIIMRFWKHRWCRTVIRLKKL